MKQILLFFGLLLPFCVFSQVKESFSGTEITSNNPWTGDLDMFTINTDGQLEFVSPLGEAGEASLYLPITYSENMSWEMDVSLGFKASNANNARIHIYTDDDILYYIQIGNNKNQISLYTKEGSKSAKVCVKGREDLISGAFISVRLLLEDGERWTLYTRTNNESFYHEEGSYTMKYLPVDPETQLQITCRYIKSRISDFYFDNIEVSNDVAEPIAPSPESSDAELVDIKQLTSYELQFLFSAPVDISNASCTIDDLGEAISIVYGKDQQTVEVRFSDKLEAEKEYYLEWNNLFDLKNGAEIELALEICLDDSDTPGEPDEPVVSDVAPGEIIFNEILPNPYSGGSEYIELYNRSDRRLSLKGLVLAVRKPDGSLSTHYPLSGIKELMEEKGYVLLTKDRRGVTSFYFISSPDILYELKLPVLANTSATLVLFRATDGVIIDEVAYSSKWHATSVKDQKGVALERIDPNASAGEASNWTSATVIAGYGTPGYQNSQYKQEENSITHIEPPVLMPDGLYYIKYRLNDSNYHCRAYVYDLNGRRVAEISNHQLTGVVGELVWDGQGGDGVHLQTGLYIIYIELYNQDGEQIKYKKPFLIR